MKNGCTLHALFFIDEEILSMRKFNIVEDDLLVFKGFKMPYGAFYGFFKNHYWILINPSTTNCDISMNTYGRCIGYNCLKRDDNHCVPFFLWDEKRQKWFHIPLDHNHFLVKMVKKNKPKYNVYIIYPDWDYIREGECEDMARDMQQPPAPRKRKGTALKEMSRRNANRKSYKRVDDKRYYYPNRGNRVRPEKGVNATTDYACDKTRYSHHMGYENREKDIRFDAQAMHDGMARVYVEPEIKNDKEVKSGYWK